MTTVTVSPLQQLVNKHAIQLAECQYRLARLFTPFGFEPERVDYDRVAAFMLDPSKAFPNPSDGITLALSRLQTALDEADAVLSAFMDQGIAHTLDADQLYLTARNNVMNPTNARAA